MPKISFKKIKEAIISYDLDFIKECVDNNSFDINTSDRSGYTGLAISIEHIVGSSLSDDFTFHSGLSTDCNIDLQKTYNIAEYFSENGYADFEVLLGKGGWGGKYTMLGYLLENYGWSADGRSAEEQKEYNFKLIKLLIKNGADINNQDAKTDGNKTPLMISVYNNYLTPVKYLVEQGATINQSSFGYTALHYIDDPGSYSSMQNQDSSMQVEIARFLLDNGADPNMHYDLRTPLHHSCEQENSNFELITLLVENRTDPKIITDPEYSPVPLTCKSVNNARKCYDYFTEKFPEIVKNDIFIKNYLLQAAKNRQFGIMKSLLELGADINTTGKNNETPLSCFIGAYAVPKEHPFCKKTATIDCIYYLIEQGAEIEIHQSDTNLLKIFVESTSEYWKTYEIEGEIIRLREDDCGYDIDGKGGEFFKYLINNGISFNEKHVGRDESVKDILNNNGIVDWLNYLEELENKGKSKKPMTININDPVECEILFVGTEMQKELGVITYKNGKESDGYKIGSEKGSWTFKWKLPHSKEAMFNVLNKGANWAYYFDGSFKEKWHEELPGVDFDDSEWHGGNGLALDNKIFDINGNEVDEEKIKDYYTAHDTESISFNPLSQNEIKFKDNNSNWVSFSLSNNMWKMLTGTGKSGKETTIESELISEKGFDLVKKIKDIFGWNGKSIK